MRSDVHRPAVMDPADYRRVGEADTHHAEGFFSFDWELYAELTGRPEVAGNDYRDAEGIEWDELTGRGSCCHCGNRRIRYWVFYVHVPSGRVVAVGTRCAERLSLDSKADIARREMVARRRLADQLREWRAADERHERAFEDLLGREDAAGGSGGAGNEFVDSLLRYARREGRLTDAQVEAVLKGIETRERREAERQEREADEPAPAPVVEGRIVVEGRLLTVKSQDSQFGSTLKMLVLDDRGFKVWGTAPQAICDGAFEAAHEAGMTEGGTRGALAAGLAVRVRFTASVERSGDDETFGFFKRPAKAKVI